MCLLTCVALIVLVYLLIDFIAPLFFDCDLKLAWAEKFGKPIDSLAGKVVWITGASSGIGKHLALALAPAGVKLVLSARRENELERVKEDCLKIGKNLTDSDVLVLPMDVTAIDKHRAHFQRVLDCFGRLDILVNNAGRSQRANWEDIDIAVDREMFELNVFSVVSLSRIAVQHFRDRKEGHVVVTSSLAGVMPAPYSASYTGSKHAIQGYFNCLRLEKIQSNISVTLLVPGPVHSEFLAKSFTGKPGEEFGKPVESTDRRMAGERCGFLCAVAIANKLEEAWMALPPLILLARAFVFYPNVAYKFIRLMGPKMLLKLRDTKIKMDTKSS